MDKHRTDGTIKGIRSDGKAQVTIRYDAAGHPVAIDAVVVSIQHDKAKDLTELEGEVKSLIIAPACATYLPVDENTTVLVNPSGRFVTGCPEADTGLTGRKLMVDTYGGLAVHGGGAFSGKDPSKVDRSGAYMARLIAKTIVGAHLAAECQVSISYAIGKADPIAFQIDTLGSGQYADHFITKVAKAVFPLRPAGVIEALGLRRAQYARLATYGHFSDGLPEWEWSVAYTEKLRREVTGFANQANTAN